MNSMRRTTNRRGAKSVRRPVVLTAIGVLAATALTMGAAAAADTPRIEEYSTPLLSKPADIKTGPDGAMYFSELTGNAIGRIDTSTKKVTEFKLPQLACPTPSTEDLATTYTSLPSAATPSVGST